MGVLTDMEHCLTMSSENTAHAKPKPVIVCAAIKYLMMDSKDDIVICGARHYDALMHPVVRTLKLRDKAIREIQGFVDQFGNFHDRQAALVIATAANQINTRRPKLKPENKLFSEDLY